MAKTNNLKDYLTDLHSGIITKKPNASRNPQDFRTTIESITTLKAILDITKSCANMFFEYDGKIDNLIAYEDTENVEDFTAMFKNYKVGAEIIKVNTYYGQIFTEMFRNARYVKVIDISKYRCSDLATADNFCSYCPSLQALVIRAMGGSYRLASNAFTNCYWLTKTVNEQFNPQGKQGYIYVPRSVIESLRSGTNWGQFKFRVLEDYTVDGTTSGEFDTVKAGIDYGI